MRHLQKKITLGRVAAERKALLRNLAESMFLHGSIRTTRAKAKAVRMMVEPLVTKAKKNTVANQRAIRKVLFTDAAVNKLFTAIAPRYIERPGGYTRVTKLGARANDAADMVRIEFV